MNEGEHQFNFDLGNSFFQRLEHSDISGGELEANVLLDKKHGVLSLHFELIGKVDVICDRCLDIYAENINVKETMFVKLGDEAGEINENVILISRDEHELVIDQYLLEFIVLALPIKKIHPDNPDGKSGCNPEMIEKLNRHLAKGNNIDKDHDPRWDDLKKLIEKNN